MTEASLTVGRIVHVVVDEGVCHAAIVTVGEPFPRVEEFPGSRPNITVEGAVVRLDPDNLTPGTVHWPPACPWGN